jgi:transposase-like protein
LGVNLRKPNIKTQQAFALYLYATGLSMNAIGQMLKVELSTVLYLMRTFALKVYENPFHKAIL